MRPTGWAQPAHWWNGRYRKNRRDIRIYTDGTTWRVSISMGVEWDNSIDEDYPDATTARMAADGLRATAVSQYGDVWRDLSRLGS